MAEDQLDENKPFGYSFEDEIDNNIDIPIDDTNQVVLHKEMF